MSLMSVRGGSVTGRGWAEYLGGTKIKFHWDDCDHTETKDYSKGPVSRQMQEGGCKLMAKWWSKEKGGVILGPCPRCTSHAKKGLP